MRFIVVHRNSVVFYAFVFLLAIGIILSADPPTIGVSTTVTKLLPIYSVETTEKVVAITFDAAWGNEDTEQIIEALNKYDAKATFFVVGDWVDRFPDSVKSLHGAGHEIANHSDRHPHPNALSKDALTADIKACQDKIKNTVGEVVPLYRPPYGEYNDNVIKTATEMGLFTIQWDVDSLDWKELTVDEIYDRVIKRTKSGSIILFHNGTKNTATALPKILQTLSEQGYKFVRVSELIYKDNYKIDHTGRQFLK